MENSKIISSKINDKLERVCFNLKEREDILKFLFSKKIYLEKNKSEINCEFIYENEKNLEHRTKIKIILLQNYHIALSKIEDLINNTLTDKDMTIEDFMIETNFDKELNFLGFFNHSIEIHLLVNIFMCFTYNKFVFKFIEFDVFDVFKII